MTYQSKAALREEIADLRWKLDLSEDKVAARFEFEAFQEEILRHAKVHAATVATRETLELVLKAFDIPDYSIIHLGGVISPPEHMGTETVVGYNTDTFHEHLQTALRLREEKKQAAEDAATEARVAALAKKDSPIASETEFVDPFWIYDAAHANQGPTGPMGPMGMKGDKGEPCDCPSKQSETVEKIIKKSKGDKK